MQPRPTIGERMADVPQRLSVLQKEATVQTERHSVKSE
jgi:hypothetical protein